MSLDRVGALRQERAKVLGLCRDLDDAEWQVASAAPGWRVQDVVAHVGSGIHALFVPPKALTMLRSKNIERTNDDFVDQRRGWAPARSLAEYECWSRRVITMVDVVMRSPLRGVRVRFAELGVFPLGPMLSGALVFDAHTHLRHDIAPALGRPVPGTDANRMAVVVEWMMAVLGNQLRAARPVWLDRPLSISLSGPGGGTWVARPNGDVHPGSAGAAAARISGVALEFPAWGTARVDWWKQGVTLSGDADYAARFLDRLNVV